MDDQALWQQFCAGSLAHSEWTHEAHVRIAYLFLERFDLDEAHLRLRAGIIRLNERHGLIESARRGYFETLTRAWLILIAAARRRTSPTDTRELVERCPELLDRHLLERYYSRELLNCTRARAIFVAPDRAALPES